MASTAKPMPSSAAVATASIVSTSSSLLVIVLDVSPFAWGERDIFRTAQDKKRAAEGKRSIGPAVIEEVLDSVLALCSAHIGLQAEAGLVVVGVADTQVATLYPRKNDLHDWLQRPETFTTNLQAVRIGVTTGIAELARRAAIQADTQHEGAMAAGLSTALCLIHRFSNNLSSTGGIKALMGADPLAPKPADDTIIAMQGVNNNKSSNSGNSNKKSSGWSPRVLMIQASDDRSRDYNAFMNCAFAAIKQQVVIDACFLPSGMQKTSPTSSPFLEQACDLTGGIFLAPSGPAQVHGGLTEVLYSVFLPPLDARPMLHLPALNKVDFRARCFETGRTVDQAFVCNQCLSIFEKQPKQHCPTCQAVILGSDTGNKRLRQA